MTISDWGLRNVEVQRHHQDDGWYMVRTNGSHRIYQHATKPGSVPVPVHSLGGDVPTGLKQAILKQAGLRSMATFTAVLEQGDDHSWSAYTLSPSLVIGTGATKEEALADLRTAMAFWLEFMKETGQAVAVATTELVNFEVAA